MQGQRRGSRASVAGVPKRFRLLVCTCFWDEQRAGWAEPLRFRGNPHRFRYEETDFASAHHEATTNLRGPTQSKIETAGMTAIPSSAFWHKESLCQEIITSECHCFRTEDASEQTDEDSAPALCRHSPNGVRRGRALEGAQDQRLHLYGAYFWQCIPGEYTGGKCSHRHCNCRYGGGCEKTPGCGEVGAREVHHPDTWPCRSHRRDLAVEGRRNSDHRAEELRGVRELCAEALGVLFSLECRCVRNEAEAGRSVDGELRGEDRSDDSL